MAGLIARLVAWWRRPPAPALTPDDEDDDAPVTLGPDQPLDLHTFSPRDLPSVVDEYLRIAVEAGLASVRIIHGKGVGVARERVHAILRRHPAVASFALAPAERGGWGATIVTLRPPPG